jgi:hypothetical protein
MSNLLKKQINSENQHNVHEKCGLATSKDYNKGNIQHEKNSGA